MRKYILKIIYLAFIFSWTVMSCSEDNCIIDEIEIENDFVEMSLSVNLPEEMLSRAGTLGDESFTNVDILYWSVFEVNDDHDTSVSPKHIGEFNRSAFTNNNQTSETISLKLAKGKKYQVAVMAKYSSHNFASFSKGHLIVDYSKTEMYNINGDAFVGKSNIIDPEEGISDAVNLTRPFAQINWGTSDLGATSVKNILSTIGNSVSISSSAGNVYQDLDILTGEVSNPIKNDITCSKTGISGYSNYTFPTSASNKTYNLISSTYILVDQNTSTTVTTKTVFSNALSAEVVVDNVPVQANYRTNIYGALITEPNIFDIEVAKGFQNFSNITVQ